MKPPLPLIQDASFGKYQVIQKRAVQSVRIKVTREGLVEVTIPSGFSLSKTHQFVESKVEWITRAIERQKNKKAQREIKIDNGTTIQLITGKIIIERLSRNDTHPQLLKAVKIIEKDGGYTILAGSDADEEAIKAKIIMAIRHSAYLYLPQRIIELSRSTGLTPNSFSLKNNKSNWGSCSSKGNINLNIHLMRLSKELCDFVILHELAHLKHPNHGPQFHQLLAKIFHGNPKEASAELKKSHPII